MANTQMPQFNNPVYQGPVTQRSPSVNPYGSGTSWPLGCSDDAYQTGCVCEECVRRHNYIAWRYTNEPSLRTFGGVSKERIKAMGEKGLLPGYDGKAYLWEAHIITEAARQKMLTPAPLAQGGYQCKSCGMKNEYAGPEHLASDGTYTCYNCK
jgi:hypothetical protein